MNWFLLYHMSSPRLQVNDSCEYQTCGFVLDLLTEKTLTRYASTKVNSYI